MNSSANTLACRFHIHDGEKMMRLLILFVTCAVMSLNPWAAKAYAQSVPQCLGGFCLDAENLPTEKAVRAQFGGFIQPAPWKALAYCYQFTEPDQQISYGRFLFKRNFGVGWRLVTIRLSQEPICADAYVVPLKTPLSTKEGIRLNSDEAEVLKCYGQPRYKLQPPSAEVIRGFLGDLPKATIDVIHQSRIQIRSATLINGLGGRDVRASEPLDRQVKVALNEIHTPHPRRTVSDCHPCQSGT